METLEMEFSISKFGIEGGRDSPSTGKGGAGG
jgi:hypothetical protein